MVLLVRVSNNKYATSGLTFKKSLLRNTSHIMAFWTVNIVKESRSVQAWPVASNVNLMLILS